MTYCAPSETVPPKLFAFDGNLDKLVLGAGKDASAYDIGGDLVYRRGNENHWLSDPRYASLYAEHLDREVAVYADLPDNVFVARTLIAWLKGNRDHKLVEKGQGVPLFPYLQPGEHIFIKEWRELWESAIAQAAEIPDAHYKKLIDDETELRKRNILMDYVGHGNLFYAPTKGFTIIDAEFEPSIPLRGRSMYMTLIGSRIIQSLIGRSVSWVGHISPQSRDSVIEVLQKLESLDYKPAYRLAFKFLCEQLDYVPAYADQAVDSEELIWGV